MKHVMRNIPQMKGLKKLWFVFSAFCLLGSIQASHAKLVQEVVKIPMTVRDGFDKEITRDVVVTVFVEDSTPQPRPVLVINHGRAVDAKGRAALGRAAYSVNSKWFAELGFAVAVPTRIGYGVTGGDDAEDTGDCNRKIYPPGYAVAAQQTLKTLEVMRQRPGTLKGRAIVVGQSVGGATSITVAALNPTGVQATINFAGGGGGNPETKPQNPCASPALEQMFSDYGKTARIPTLWIYTENDMYFGPKLPKQWFDAFKAAGGSGEYMLYPPVGKNGHGFFTLAPDVWRPRVLEFLKANGYPHLKPPAAEKKSPEKAEVTVKEKESDQ